MSILNALKQQRSSIDDLAKLPQAMIMQMAQKKEISADMLAPILSRKAEMMDAVARSRALQPQPPVPTVMEQVMKKNIQAENPQSMPPQSPMEGPAPTSLEQVGVGQIPVPERQYAGGGIIAFKQGDLVDLEDDIDEEDLIAEYANAMKAGEMAMSRNMEGNAGTGFRYTDPIPSGGSKGINYQGGKHPYESLVTTKAKEHGVDPMLASYILNKETGNMKNPENARSSAGAMGIAQFMPATAKQYNINPDIPEEAAVGMSKHLKHLVNTFGDPKIAAIAYNWGEGNTKKWLNAGADMNKLPKETKKYVASLAQGGEVKHFAEGSLAEARKQREDALDVLRTNMPDVPTDFSGSLTDYLSKPERAAAYEKNQIDREIARKAIMENNPLPSLKRDILNPAANLPPKSVPSVVPTTIPSAVPPTAKPPAVPIAQTGLTPDEMIAGSSRAGNFEAMMNDKTTGRALPSAAKVTPEQGFYEKAMAQMGYDREDIAKQRATDKNMALLAAGLGMMGGTSPYAFANIGQGGLHGVQYLSEANKQRAAEKAALDKNMLVAQRYKDLGEAAKGNQAGLMAIRQGELDVHRGTLDNNQKKLLENSLDRMDKAASATANAWIKANPMAGFSLENASDIEHVKNQLLAKNPRYNSVYQQLEGVPFEYNSGSSKVGGTLAEQAAAEKDRRKNEKK